MCTVIEKLIFGHWLLGIHPQVSWLFVLSASWRQTPESSRRRQSVAKGDRRIKTSKTPFVKPGPLEKWTPSREVDPRGVSRNGADFFNLDCWMQEKFFRRSHIITRRYILELIVSTKSCFLWRRRCTLRRRKWNSGTRSAASEANRRRKVLWFTEAEIEAKLEAESLRNSIMCKWMFNQPACFPLQHLSNDQNMFTIQLSSSQQLNKNNKVSSTELT